MASCPFCKSTVIDDATVCPKCHAEKETTFKGHFERAVVQMKSVIGLLGIFGLLIGFAFGLSIGMATYPFIGFIVGFAVFLFVMFFPAIIKAFLKKNKVVWYR